MPNEALSIPIPSYHKRLTLPLLAMLRTAASRAPPLYRSALGLSLARRSLSTSASRFNDLHAKKTHEEAFAGAEGRHLKDQSIPQDIIATSPTGGEVKGDWVLFHPVYSADELKAVEVLHRDGKNFSDKFAIGLAKLLRWGFDLVSGYKHKTVPAGSTMTLEELRKGGYVMNEHEWLNRILFLESIAGVPGMVAATVRHLTSLRLMRRDSGWIHTLLEEAENERMHLMTFMTLRNPGIFFRALILGAQGVFYNIFFFSYLFSPSTCHRFVGYLEEEAVRTYSSCINELEAGRLPLWKDKPAPEIAKDYWRLAPNATMLDVIYAVRSDESTHRFVNHSLANLQKDDVNPFALREPDMHVKGKLIEFDRAAAAKYVNDSHQMVDKQQAVHQ